MANLKLFDDISKEYKKINNTKNRVDDRFLLKIDKEKAYEGLFLYSIILFERYLEDLFFFLMKGKIVGKRGSGIKINDCFIIKQNISDRDIEILILGEKPGDYLDRIPFPKTLERSKRFFCEGKPFTEIDANDKQTLNIILQIRNCIAHKSKISISKLKDTFPNFKDVYTQLSKIHSNNMTFFDFYLLTLSSICGKLQSKLKTK